MNEQKLEIECDHVYETSQRIVLTTWKRFACRTKCVQKTAVGVSGARGVVEPRMVLVSTIWQFCLKCQLLMPNVMFSVPHLALEKRDRTCDNPPAAFGGRKCSDGNQSWREETNHEWMPPRPANYTQHSIELRDCSSLSECDLDNDFSPAVEQLIRIAERHRPASSYILSSNQSVTFVCNTSLYEQALRVLSLPVNASQLKIEWYLNSQIMMSPDRSIQVNDSYAGVWACVVAPQGSVRRRLIVDFHLIAVRSLLNISAQNASDMSNALVCHSWPLQAIRSYSNVSIVWLRNDVEVERHVALEWSEPNSPALLQNKPLDPSKVKLMEENANTANASSSPLASQVREYKCVVREWNEDGISKEWITSHYQINWTDFKSDDYKHLSIFYGYMFWLLILVAIFSHFLITTRNT